MVASKPIFILSFEHKLTKQKIWLENHTDTHAGSSQQYHKLTKLVLLSLRKLSTTQVQQGRPAPTVKLELTSLTNFRAAYLATRTQRWYKALKYVSTIDVTSIIQ